MRKTNSIRHHLSCAWDEIRSFFLFIARIPGFYRLNRFWDNHPRFYWDTINNYVKVMYTFTDGKLSKPTHSADTVIEESWECIDRNMREETKQNAGNGMEQ